MRTWVHLLVSLLLAAILYPTLGWKVLFILAGGVLIDIDHYLWYVHKHKKFGLIGCYNNFTIEAEKSDWKNVNGILLIFHTIEFLLIIITFELGSNRVGLAYSNVWNPVFVCS